LFTGQVIKEMKKSKRNSLCGCKSGKKYKYCCGATYEQRGARRNARSQKTVRDEENYLATRQCGSQFDKAARRTKQLDKNHLERLESFLGYLWDRKLWTLTWGGFISCLYFVVSFYVSFPIELAKIEEYEEKASYYQSDHERAKAVIEKTEQSLVSFTEPVRLSLLAMYSSNGENSRKVNQNALESISKMRRDLSYSIGAIQSGAFRSPSFGDFFNGYVEDLTNLDRYLVYFQEVLTNRTARSAEQMRLERINNTVKFVESHQSLTERNAALLKRLNAIASEANIERNEQHRKSSILRLKPSFVVLGLVYIGLFLLLAVVRWHRFNRKRQKKSANIIDGLLESVERFADHKSNKKLWGLGSFLFGICCWFLVSTVNAAPEEIATIERFQAHLRFSNEDSLQIGVFWINFDGLYKSREELTRRLIDTRNETNTDPRTTRDRFEGDIYFFSRLRGEIAKQLGTSKGLTFQASDYVNYFAQIDENLKQYDAELASLEQIFHRVVDRSITEKEILEILSKLRLGAAQDALRESVSNAHEKLIHQIKVLDIEEKEFKAHKRILMMRVIAIIPSTFYILAFSFLAIRSWVKFRRV
jgi:hypothetical protein